MLLVGIKEVNGMPRTVAKVAISVPAELYEELEADRRAEGMGRSEYFVHAVNELLRHKRDDARIQQYLRGYAEHPETADDLLSEQAMADALAQEPWDG
jgi:metal-responsive CopG/Arc/MetJ family transcriptional regulator